MNKTLKVLLNNIIDGLYDHPLTIKNKVHILHISPYIESEDWIKDWICKEWESECLQGCNGIIIYTLSVRYYAAQEFCNASAPTIRLPLRGTGMQLNQYDNLTTNPRFLFIRFSV